MAKHLERADVESALEAAASSASQTRSGIDSQRYSATIQL